MNNTLYKTISRTFIPGSPGQPGHPGQPFRAARWENQTRDVCSYTPDPNIMASYGFTYQWVPGYSVLGVWFDGQWTWVPPDGFTGSVIVPYVYLCRTEVYQVYVPGQPYIAPTPAIPSTPAQTILDFNIGWTGRARSIRAFANAGETEFKVHRSVTGAVVGLNTAFNATGYADIRYAFYLSHGIARVMESGSVVANLGAYAEGAVFKLRRYAGKVTYFVDDVEVWESDNSPEPMHLDAALYIGDDTVFDPAIEGLSYSDTAFEPLHSIGSEDAYAFSATEFQPLQTASRAAVGGQGVFHVLTGLGSDRIYGSGTAELPYLTSSAEGGFVLPSYAIADTSFYALTGVGAGLTGEIGGATSVFNPLGGLGSGGTAIATGSSTTVTNPDSSITTTEIVVAADGSTTTTTTTTTNNLDGSTTVVVVVNNPDGTTTTTTTVTTPSVDGGSTSTVIDQTTTTTTGSGSTTTVTNPDSSITTTETVTTGGSTTTTTTTTTDNLDGSTTVVVVVNNPDGTTTTTTTVTTPSVGGGSTSTIVHETVNAESQVIASGSGVGETLPPVVNGDGSTTTTTTTVVNNSDGTTTTTVTETTVHLDGSTTTTTTVTVTDGDANVVDTTTTVTVVTTNPDSSTTTTETTTGSDGTTTTTVTEGTAPVVEPDGSTTTTTTHETTTTVVTGTGTGTTVPPTANPDGSTTTTTTTVVNNSDGTTTTTVTETTVYPDGSTSTTTTVTVTDGDGNVVDTTTTVSDTTAPVTQLDGSTTTTTTTTVTANDGSTTTTVTGTTTETDGSTSSVITSQVSYGEATVVLHPLTASGYLLGETEMEDVGLFSAAFSSQTISPFTELVVVMTSSGEVGTVFAYSVAKPAEFLSTLTLTTPYSSLDELSASIITTLAVTVLGRGVGEETQVWVLNTETEGSTRYENYAFNSFAKIGDSYFGCKADGIYKLEGADDAGDPIRAMLSFGKWDFGTSYLKQVPHCYVGVSSNDRVFMKVIVEGEEYLYVANSNSEQMQAHRVDLGRGLEATYFEFELYNADGDDFELASVEFVVVPTTRRV